MSLTPPGIRFAWHRSNEASRRLESIPGIGPIIATALVASVSVDAALIAGRFPLHGH